MLKNTNSIADKLQEILNELKSNPNKKEMMNELLNEEAHINISYSKGEQAVDIQASKVMLMTMVNSFFHTCILKGVLDISDIEFMISTLKETMEMLGE